MQVTLDIPDPLAKKFFSTTPARRRSSTVTRLLRAELRRKELAAPDLENGAAKSKKTAELKPGWFHEGFKEFIGILKDGPPDMAENHDHYAHGAPRRKRS
jgi:hypothetical protein